MKANLQGADHDLDPVLYKIAFKYISNNSQILNLGCGMRFNFEKEIIKEKKVNILSADILNIQNVPNTIKFKKLSVEKKFQFKEKFDIITFFELIEHIDKTDVLLENCFNNLKKDGLLIFSVPNLSSIYGRIELLLGFQPHILEVSNKNSNFGTGIFGRYNNPNNNSPVHHIRGISHKAIKEMLAYYGFEIITAIGYEHHFKILRNLFYLFPSIAPVNIFICKKIEK